MLALIGTMCAAFFNVFITDGRFMQPYNTARMLFLGIAGYLLLAAWILSGPEIRIAGEACALIVWMVSFWAVSAVLARKRAQAIRQFLLIAFCVWFGVFLVPGADTMTVIRMLVAVAVLSAVVGLIVNVGRVRLFRSIRDIKAFPNAGLIGNYKAHGTYLMMCVFPAGYLGVVDHPFWLAGLGVMLWAIWRTSSRTAMLGLLAGGVFFALAAGLPAEVFVGVIVVLIVLILTKVKLGGHEFPTMDSVKERRNYAKVGWQITMEKPVFGIGFWNFMAYAPFAQRTLDKASKGKFLKKENYMFPWPESAHNDCLQWLCDCGIIGCMPMALLIGYLCGVMYLTRADPLVPYIGAALVAFLAAGLTWHVSYILPVSMTAWCWVGLLLKQANHEPWAWAASNSWGVEIPGLIALAWLVWEFIVKEGVFRRRFAKYLTTGDRKHLIAALKASPDDGQANNHAAQLAWREGNYEMAYVHAAHAIEHYDGQVPLWMLYSNGANICMQHGAFTLANAYFNQALSFLPWYEPAIIGKAQLAETTVKFSFGAQKEKTNERREPDQMVL